MFCISSGFCDDAGRYASLSHRRRPARSPLLSLLLVSRADARIHITRNHIVRDELGVMASDEQKPRNINSKGKGQFSVEPR
jgi:hypothetical protein